MFGKPLTEREIGALELAARGDTVKQTAERMIVAPETVKTYRKNAMAKLGARSVTAAVAYAIGLGMVNLDALMDYRDEVIPDYGDL